eukprot:511564-Rhodomonas_salina.1
MALSPSGSSPFLYACLLCSVCEAPFFYALACGARYARHLLQPRGSLRLAVLMHSALSCQCCEAVDCAASAVMERVVPVLRWTVCVVS